MKYIYKLLKEAHRPAGFSKKQLRMLAKSKTVEPKRWKEILRNFKGVQRNE